MLDSPSPSARSDEDPLRVLLIEDNPQDAQLFRDYLQEGRRPMEVRWEQDLSAGLQALREQPIDVVVLDLGLPESQGVDTVRRFADAAPSVPVVVLTGEKTLETALAAQQAGATEYLRKDELTPSLAERTLRWAAERARMERTLRRAQRQQRAVFEDPNLLAGLLGTDGTVRDVNRTALGYIGASLGEIAGERFWETPWFEGDAALQEQVRTWIRRAAAGEYVEFEADHTEAVGAPLIVEGVLRPVTDETGEVTSLLISGRDVTERRREEEERRLFEKVVNQANDAIVVTEAAPLDEPGPRIEYVNQAFTEMTGYPEEEVLGETPRMLQGPGTEREVLDSLRAALEAGESWEGETTNYKHDGTPYVVRWSLAPVRGAEGEIEQWVSVQQDVTEKREREERLRRQRNLLEQTQRLAGAWEIDLRSGAVSASEKVYEIHEVEHSTTLDAEGVLDFYPSEVRPQVWEAFRRCAEEGEPYDLELPLITANDNHRWIRTVGAPAETEEDVTKVAGAFQDITERKKEERRLEVLFEDSPDMIDVQDGAGNILRANPRFFEKTGYREDDLPDLKVWDLDEAIEPAEAQQVWAEMEAGDRRQLEGTYRRKDGSTFPVEVHIRRLRLEGEDRFMAISRDITERRHRQRELKDERDRLKTLFESLPTPVVRCVMQEGGTYISDANKAFEEVFGVEAAAAEGKDLNELIVPEEKRQKGVELDRRALQDAQEREVQRLSADGTRDFRLQVAGRQREDGPPEIYAIYTDVTEQKRRERALEETNSTLEAVLANLPHGILAEDGSRHVIAANESLCEAFGVPVEPAQLEGRDCAEAARDIAGVTADPDRFTDRIWEILNRGEPVFGEEIQLTDGRILERDFVPYQLSGNDAALWMYRNITERRRRQQELERQNDLFEKAQEIASIGGWEYDVHADEQRWTDELHRIVGHESPDAPVPSVEEGIELYHPDDRSTIRDAFTRAVEEGRSYDIEVRLISKQGEEKWVRARGEPQREEGEIVRVRGTVRDITKRKQRERALQRRRQVAESIYDATGRLLRAESRGAVSDRVYEVFERVFDYPLVHVGLVDGEVIVPQKTAAEGLSRTPKAEPRPTGDDLVVTRALRAGETVVVDDVGTLDNDIDYGSLSSLAGIPIGERGAVVVGTEQAEELDRFDLHLIEVMARYAALVLERLDREEQLVKAKEEAEEASRLKTNMLANMSHEIRTPLTPIIGFAESLAEQLEGPEAQLAGRIEKSGKRLQQTLDSILALSQLESGTYELSRKELDLREVVREETQRLQRATEKKDPEPETDLPDHPVRGTFSEGAVRRIGKNLLENAIKFTPEGGEVNVEVRSEEDTAVLAVEDTGVGISQEAQPEIFEAFQQESKGWAREYEGTGLGLSIVERLAEAHGGRVEVESEKGEGSRFLVYLPTDPSLESEDVDAR